MGALGVGLFRLVIVSCCCISHVITGTRLSQDFLPSIFFQAVKAYQVHFSLQPGERMREMKVTLLFTVPGQVYGAYKWPACFT